MNTDVVAALLAGLVAGSGIALLILGLRGSQPTPARPDGIPGLTAFTAQALSASLRRLVLAIALGVLALVVSGWPVFGIGVFLLTQFSPIIIGGFFRSSGDIGSLEALAGWVESLRDVIAGAVGLEQALPATATTAGAAIAGPLAQLVERLRVRVALPEALARFADDLDDPSADLVVAALVLNARLRGPGLRDVLSALAISTREELDMRRRIEAQRRSTRRSVQVVVAVVVLVIVGLTVFNHRYVEPYDTALGQVVLTIVIGLFVAGFLWLKRLASFEVPDRFVTAESGQAVQAMTDRLVADTVASSTAVGARLGSPMIPALLTGGVAGLGLLLAVLLVRPARVSVATQLLRLDAERVAAVRAPVATSIAEDSLSQLQSAIGARAARLWRSRGWGGDRLRADLAILGRSLDGYLATKLLLAFGGLLLPPVLVLVLALVGQAPSALVPFWASVLLALIGFVLPDAALRGEAEKRRTAFRHAVGAFLDLVSMNLAGGRGVPEALLAAATVGQGWPFRRLREVLSTARLAGLTPWAALGHLGEEIAVDELRDLAASLSLVAEDGAKVRQSLSARAASMRRKEMTEAEGAANENSQSMLVAQMLLCAAFLLFLLYPAVISIFKT